MKYTADKLLIEQLTEDFYACTLVKFKHAALKHLYHIPCRYYEHRNSMYTITDEQSNVIPYNYVAYGYHDYCNGCGKAVPPGAFQAFLMYATWK